MDRPTSFGQWLKQRRTALDLTQQELAEQIGCAEETLRKLEADARRPSKQIAQRLAEVLFAEPAARRTFIQVARGLTPDEPAPVVSAARHNLPAQLTSFIGRAREGAEVAAALARSRLVTLTGVGGTGKTRLALEVAATLRDAYPGGVWVIELAPLADPDLVPYTVAAVLGLREEPGRPLLATLTAALQAAPTLLILDNCEHLLVACAQLAATLLHACPQLRILTTSREVLHILGETIYLVPPLAIPDAQHLPPVAEVGQIAAVRLFLERAQAAQRQFGLTEANVEAVAAICQRLDGLPLAIELAAARVRTLPVAELAARLDQRFRLLTGGNRTALPRHQTLHALIEWSYDLLTLDEQRLFRRLAVFAGGWTLDAAEAVCAGAGLDTEAILDLLTHLVDKSLVVVEPHTTPARYTMLETIRQYALERLHSEGTRSGEAETVQRRHAEYYLALAEEAEPAFETAQRGVWLERLAGELDNIRAALTWSQEDAESAEIGVRLAGTLWMFWYFRSQLSEGRAWLEGALRRHGSRHVTATTGAGLPQPASRPLSKALFAAGYLAYLQNDYAVAHGWQAASEVLFQDLGDRHGLALTLLLKAWIALAHGNPAAAREFQEQSVALFREVDAPWWLAVGLWNLGYIQLAQGRIAEARPVLEESLQLFQAIPDPARISLASSDLARVAYLQGDYRMAHAYLQQTLALLPTQETYSVPNSLERLAALAAARGQPERVAVLLGAVDALRTSLNRPATPVDHANFGPALAAAHTQLGEPAFKAAWAKGQAMTLEQAVAYALEGVRAVHE